MTPDDLEARLRRAGRPAVPPERLQRAALNLPGGGPRPVSHPRIIRLGLAAALALVVLAGASVVVTRGNPAFQPVATVELGGARGGEAEAKIGSTHGPNRPLVLSVRHLQPGSEQYFELWSYSEKPPMMLATFMTSRDGSCIVTLSVPRTVDWQDLVITPRERSNQPLLCSNHGRCA